MIASSHSLTIFQRHGYEKTFKDVGYLSGSKHVLFKIHLIR